MFPRKVILRVLLCTFLAVIPFPEQENHIYDLKLRLLHNTVTKRPDSVVILEFSKDDFEKLKNEASPAHDDPRFSTWQEKYVNLRNEFYWDEQVYSHLFREVLSRNPQRLLVTNFYNENLVLLQNNPELRRFARNPKILWASQFDLDLRLLKPSPDLTGTENYGYTNIYPDPDGVVRRAHLILRNHISLPFRALINNLDEMQKRIPVSTPFLIRFLGGSGFIPRCRVSELLHFEEGSPCNDLSGKYVILTAAENSVAGTNPFPTPLGTLDRGEVLANILLTAKDEAAYIPVSNRFVVFFVFFHALALGLMIMNFTGQRQLFVTIGLLSFETMMSLLALRTLSWQIPLMPFFVATICTFFFFLALKISQQDTRRWQAEKKALYLRELDELKSNFMSLMSHDLKTPIAKIQALTERLTREAQSLSPAQKDILASIQRSNEELTQYILSILNFQRIESQQLTPNLKSHDINLIIEDVVKRLEPLATDRGIILQTQLEPMFPVDLDEQLIKQVLNNLIENAIKYNSTGVQVTIHSVDLGEMVEVTVADNGVGIAAGQMTHLFKKFSRAQKLTSERVKGTGLGLYLAKYFIELHGGTIDVQSQPSQGTKFSFRLPVKTHSSTATG